MFYVDLRNNNQLHFYVWLLSVGYWVSFIDTLGGSQADLFTFLIRLTLSLMS